MTFLRYFPPLLFAFLFVAITFTASVTHAQSVSVADGPELETAVANATAGTVIELTTDGGVYEITGTLQTDVPLTIRAADDLDDRPQITSTNTSLDADELIEAEDDLTLEGLDLNSNEIFEEVLRVNDDANPDTDVTIRDCIVRGTPDGDDGIRINGLTVMGDLILEDVLITDIGRRPLAVRGGAQMDRFEVVNSSIYFSDTPKSSADRLRIDGATITDFVFDRVTLSQVPGDAIDIATSTITNATFTNVLVVDYGSRALEAGDDVTTLTIEHSGVWPDAAGAPDNTVFDTSAETAFNASTTNFFENPNFRDANNGDLDLDLAASNAVLGGSDGTYMGDLNQGLYTPTSATLDLGSDRSLKLYANALEEAPGGVTFRLTDAGPYEVDDEIGPEVDLTITGASGGMRSMIQAVAGGFGDTFFRPDAGFTLDGVVVDGRGAVEEIVRFDNDEGADLTISDAELIGSGDGEDLVRLDDLIGTVLIENSIIRESGRRPIATRSGADISEFTVRNVTIYDAEDRLRFEGPADTFLIEKVTFFGIPGDAIDLADATFPDNSITIRDALIVDYGSRAIEAGSQNATLAIEHTNVFPSAADAPDGTAFDSEAAAAFAADATNFHEDPIFENPANGNFNVNDNATQTRTGASDGGQVGDRFNQTNWLPVELVAFDASAWGSRVDLTWQTAGETSNAGFDVQHAPGATDDFAKIGYVEGRGTTTVPQTYRFRVDDLEPGKHAFRLRQVDIDGASELSDEIEVTLGTNRLALLGNAPNPFTKQTTIRYVLPEAAHVRLTVYNVLGQVVARLVDAQQPADAYAVTWDGGSAQGQPVASGTYFVRLDADGRMLTQPMTVVR